MYRVAWSILRSEMDCGDAMQECVLKAWTSRHKLRDEALFPTWIIRILINECRNIQRKQKKYHFAAEVAHGAECPFPDTDLQSAIDGLPEKLRLPFVFHHVTGYSVREVAGLLRLPASTIRDRLYRARKALRIELNPEKEARVHEA